jgi:hypothetical protein
MSMSKADKKPPWAGCVALDFVEWAAAGPYPGQKIWPRLEKAPEEGARIFVWFRHGKAAIGERSTHLFRPALSALNGWSEYPEELAASALIDVRIENVAHQGERDHWYEVSVERVVFLASFGDLFDPIDLGRLPDLRTFERTSSAERGEWFFAEGSTQGDLGEWVVCRRVSATAAELLLHGVWFPGESVVYAGRRPVSARYFETAATKR